AQHFLRFHLHLLFFFGDVGNHVAKNIERGHAGIAGATDGLHGDDKNFFNPNFLVQGGKRHDQAGGGAVGIGDDEAARLAPPALRFDERHVAGIHFGNEQRNIGLHAEGAGVGDDNVSGGGKA